MIILNNIILLRLKNLFLDNLDLKNLFILIINYIEFYLLLHLAFNLILSINFLIYYFIFHILV